MLWSGFIIGLSGSLHCVGMCGPIAMIIPGAKGKNRFVVIGLYHTGKILAYLTIGSVFGMIPALIDSFLIQSVIIISAGTLMLLIALIPPLLSKFESRGFTFFNNYFNFKNKLAQSLNKNKIEYSFYIGFLNGFVPCGMVYLAAIGALSQTHFLDSILFMLLFGLGTLPVMALFQLTLGIFKTSFSTYAVKLRTVGFIAAGAYMIWQGSAHLNSKLEAPKEGEKSEMCIQLPVH